jgi:plastocyanin
MQEEGATFEYAFEEGGNTQYFCNPHKGSGMKAAVIVE